ncbi:PREDICTED: uncharacterized protein LOC106749613 [Dinoponera quadriceps]|uniref:Uncharacterized protein LOC106749613 n=1 Tax=Dinoponera quadriceps TaxID=609295 RepID=A0A6P3Y390_DINQU|nr:PREDICTED: uncharacterized protein LOC106749613 [Dinoponera quadriceps]
MKNGVEDHQFRTRLSRWFNAKCFKTGGSLSVNLLLGFLGVLTNTRRNALTVLASFFKSVKKIRKYCWTPLLLETKRGYFISLPKRNNNPNSGVTQGHQSQRSSNKLLLKLLTYLGWTVMPHPPYSPDLAPSDYHLFPKLKEHLCGQRFRSDNEVKE